MDYLRSCYFDLDRVFSDSQRTMNKKWYFAADDASFFPGVHSHAALAWDRDKTLTESTYQGETLEDIAYWNGPGPARGTGSRYYGKAENFIVGVPLSALGSVPVDADGIPIGP